MQRIKPRLIRFIAKTREQQSFNELMHTLCLCIGHDPRNDHLVEVSFTYAITFNSQCRAHFFLNQLLCGCSFAFVAARSLVAYALCVSRSSASLFFAVTDGPTKDLVIGPPASISSIKFSAREDMAVSFSISWLIVCCTLDEVDRSFRRIRYNHT